MWYRGAGWGFPTGVGVADSTDGGLTWKKYESNPVYADPIDECAGQPWVYKEAPDKWWLYTTTNHKPARTCIAESTDGLSWKNVSRGTFHNRSHVPLPPSGTMFGNRAVWKEAEGVWRMLQECGTTDGVWEVFLYYGTSALEWAVANEGAPLRQLQQHPHSMYGGCHVATIDGTVTPRNPSDGLYHIWYHAGANGNLPTDIYHATSPDLLDWTVTPKPVLQHQGSGSFAFDQVADPSPLTVGEGAYMAYDGDNNQQGVNVHAAIGMAVARATEEEEEEEKEKEKEEEKKEEKKEAEEEEAPAHADTPLATATNWAGINSYYLHSCNASIRSEALNAVKAAGIKVVRVVLLGTTGSKGGVAACSDTPTPDVEPHTVGEYDDTILEGLDDLMYDAAARGLKLTVPYGPLTVHSLCTHCTFTAHSLCTHCTLTVHSPYTHCTLTVHSLCTHCTLTMHYTLCTVHYALYTIHYTLCTIHDALYTMHYTLYTMHYALCTMHYTLYSLYTMHYTLYTMHYTLYTMHYALCTMHYALCTIYRWPCMIGGR
jgi:hypothetical protein